MAGREDREHPAPVVSAASAEDAEEILALQKLAYESEARFYNDWSIPPLTQTLEGMREDLATKLVLKAVAGGRIVGSVRAHLVDGVCRVGRLIVHPDFQRRGIGSRLLSTIEESFPEAEKLELFTGSESEATIRLYRRHGYVVTRTERQTPSVLITYLEKLGPVALGAPGGSAASFGDAPPGEESNDG
mgnify:FL=1